MKLSAGGSSSSEDNPSTCPVTIPAGELATAQFLAARTARIHSRLHDLHYSHEKACEINSKARQTALLAINSCLSALQEVKNDLDTQVKQAEITNDQSYMLLETDLQAQIEGLCMVETRLRDVKRTTETMQAAIHNAKSLTSPIEVSMKLLELKEDCGQGLLRSISQLHSDWSTNRCVIRPAPKSGFKRKHVPIAPNPPQEGPRPSVPSASLQIPPALL